MGLWRSLVLASIAGFSALGGGGCYSQGDGATPPIDQFYFPVGLQVSHGGTVLYAVNSNFDLQYNGGTLQSYDLRQIRRDALEQVRTPAPGCPAAPPTYRDDGSGRRQPLGETCAPPVDSRRYFRDGAVIGAFATDLLRSTPASGGTGGGDPRDRLFMAVRGNATVTWASVERDEVYFNTPDAADAPYGPFAVDCGQRRHDRCDAVHQAGKDPHEENNTRNITMPGEPFGMALSEDSRSLVITHQNDTKTSLFDTGLGIGRAAARPSLQFVLEQMPVGGVGLTAIPHDREAFGDGEPFPRPAFLQTSRSVPQISLLRYYADEVGEAAEEVSSSLRRPFLNREAAFPITINASGNDSRGLLIDPTPRLACKRKVAPADPTLGRTEEDVAAERRTCARKPARVFIANRSPASLLVGEIGVASPQGTYDSDRLVLHGTVPLTAGPSKVFLAPIVDRDGAFALRVFIVCFDSATIFVYDPDADVIENVIRTGPGPFAMAFDPFTLDEIAGNDVVPFDTLRYPRESSMRRYRFAYVASFTQSFVQVIDLDNGDLDESGAPRDRATFERVVFTLGKPTNPKGS